MPTGYCQEQMAALLDTFQRIFQSTDTIDAAITKGKGFTANKASGDAIRKKLKPADPKRKAESRISHGAN